MSHSWSYGRCSACACDKRQIRPSGPIDAGSPRIMLIGESPGFHDDRTCMPFAGQVGKELDRTYLPLAHLNRDNIFCTYLVQCRQERNGADIRPGANLLETCAHNHLAEEIWTVLPDIIILCGAAPCALIPELSKLEFEHGFPRQMNECAGLGGWSGIVVPMYSPAAGMRESRYMIPQIEDWDRLGEYLRGNWVPPTEHLTVNQKPNYFLASTRDEVQNYFHSYGDCLDHQMPRILAIDSESDEGKDWSIQVSIERGTGLMVLLTSKDALNELVMYCFQLIACGWELVFHHAPADIDLSENIGINCDEYRDTMQELYALGNLPQGLKAAVYRTIGSRMRSYADVVLPWSKSVLMQWLAAAAWHAESEMQETIPHPIGKNCPTCGKTHRKDVTKFKAHECEAVIRRVMKYVQENPDYDPWIKPKTAGNGDITMRLLGRQWLAELEIACGRMPRASIIHVPISEARDYGCSDADHTGQLAAWLTAERARIVKQEWKVA